MGIFVRASRTLCGASADIFLATAVVMSITGAAPFNGTADQTLSVAYIAGFLLVYMVSEQLWVGRSFHLRNYQITFFPMGGSRLIGFDFVGPDVESEEVREATRRRRKLIFLEWPRRVVGLGRNQRAPRSASIFDGKSIKADDESIAPEAEKPQRPRLASKHVSFDQDASVDTHGVVATSSSPLFAEGWHSQLTSPAPTATAVDTTDILHTIGGRPATPILPTMDPHATARSPWAQRRKAISANMRTFLRNLFLPGSVSILISFVIALVPELKALFVQVDGTHIHPAPDGDPPLAFVIDAASFIGAASVPMGLVCLGSALARLSIPRGAWGSLPSGAILGLAIGKMIVSPVLGVLICKGLVNVNVISKEDKVLQFVCMWVFRLVSASSKSV